MTGKRAKNIRIRDAITRIVFHPGHNHEEGDTGRAYRKEVGEAASEPETSSNSSSNEWQEAFLF
jgi:hypothetical protein